MIICVAIQVKMDAMTTTYINAWLSKCMMTMDVMNSMIMVMQIENPASDAEKRNHSRKVQRL
jgi:hypothetical protein